MRKSNWIHLPQGSGVENSPKYLRNATTNRGKGVRDNGGLIYHGIPIPSNKKSVPKNTCAVVKSRYIGDGHPTFNDGNPYNGYINPYYWVDDHPLLYGSNGSLDPGTHPRLASRGVRG